MEEKIVKDETTSKDRTGQILSFAAAVTEQLPRDMTVEDREYWRKNKDELKNVLAVLRRSAKSFDWSDFYKRNFGITLSQEFVVSEQRPGIWKLVITQGLTLEQAYAAGQKKFQSWKNLPNLDRAVAKNDRDPKNGTYAVSFKANVEADEEFKKVSANQIEKRKVKGITLLERIVLELYYYELTGQHLDLVNWTLCTGSRYSDGVVPCASWDDDEFHVGWCSPDDADSHLRARAVVS